MITRTGQYAVRAVVCLAESAEQANVKAVQIADVVRGGRMSAGGPIS